MEQFFTIAILVLSGFIFFMLYFFFKSLQFVVQAVNLYKDMISRQDMMIKQLEYIKNRLSNTGDPGIEPAPEQTIKPTTHYLDDSDREILKRFAFLKRERPNLSENELVDLISETDNINKDQVNAAIKKAKEIQKNQLPKPQEDKAILKDSADDDKLKIISYYKELKQKYGNIWSENSIHVKIQQELKFDRKFIDDVISEMK